jgi:hypothetical protein
MPDKFISLLMMNHRTKKLHLRIYKRLFLQKKYIAWRFLINRQMPLGLLK